MKGFSDLTEGYLVAVKVDSEASFAEFVLIDTAMCSWRLQATGVKEICVMEMRLRNIVDRISSWDKSDECDAYREHLVLMFYGMGRSLVEGGRVPLVEQAITQIQSGKALLVEIEPVYGARVLILAEAFSLLKTA